MRTILIVDDQSRIRETYRQILLKDGYYVLEASTADEANEILKNETVDLMLLDIKMPGVSGKILYEIRKMFHQDTKVIVCSVYPLEDQKQIIQGAHDYFDKSEGLNALRQKVSHLCKVVLPQKHLVIIDDEQKVRILYSSILNKAGYLTKAFGDNKSAIKYLGNGKAQIDLLILDLAMPKIDGCHFHEIIRMRHPETKILIASNYEINTQKFMIFDANDYFDKSEGNSVLIRKVRKLMRQSPKKGGVR